jgi:hypothetical protein
VSAGESELRDTVCGMYFPDAEVEVVLGDKSRVDCLGEDYAVEVDYSHKWAECIGQALWYAHTEEKVPVCVLLMDERSRPAHITRFLGATRDINIKLIIFRTSSHEGF